MTPPCCGAVVEVLSSTTVPQRLHVTPADSLLVESPLPGGAAEVVRFLLNTLPPWMQIGGLLAGCIAGAAMLWWVVRHHRALLAWHAARPRAIQWAIAAVIVAALVGAGGFSRATWNYTQHSNDFCTGCHVMDPAFQRFAGEENKHGTLSCHACHQQSPLASMRQLYLWIAERPERIGPHAKVPNRVCETCHVTGDTARWQHVAATAGHRVHLESDSSALDTVQCVTCHGVEVHRFRPVKETCGQSSCHETSETEIVLGAMASQTVRHCTSCHAFTAEVPALATRDSARGTLVPGEQQCLGCHQMREVLADFVAKRDPHGAKCGTCHDPHRQRTPSSATSCAAAGCHADWRETPFHVGASHRRTGPQCLTCHQPHRAKLDASDCAGCHAQVRAKGKQHPPVPFDTAAAVRRARIPPALPPLAFAGARSARHSGPRSDDDSGELQEINTGTGPGLGAGVRIFATTFTPAPHAGQSAAVRDSFPHSKHTSRACLECHQTGSGHGRLTFERPRGCNLCHHEAPTPAKCATCHRPEQFGVPRPVTVTINVPHRTPKPRTVEFRHERHASRPCMECHTTPVSLAPEPAKAQCTDCHAEHHGPDRECGSCHRLDDPKVEHQPVDAAHQRCDACHTPASIARLTPTRSFCSTCHPAKATTHFERQECTTCHFLAEPQAYRPRLLSPSPR